jgi:hypothetical protein
VLCGTNEFDIILLQSMLKLAKHQPMGMFTVLELFF